MSLAVKAPLRNIAKDAFSGHKICTVHGLQHLMVRDAKHPSQTGMCGHPDCIGGLLTTLQHIPQCGYLIRFCRKLDADRHDRGSFEIHVIESLLKEAQRGKPTILNPFFTRWTCLSYLTKLKKEEFKEAQHKEILRQIDGLLEEDAQQVLETLQLAGISNSFMTSRIFKSPEKVLAEKEFITLFIEEWGKELYLHYMGELTAVDWMKITGLRPYDLITLRNEVEKWVKFIHVPKIPDCK